MVRIPGVGVFDAARLASSVGRKVEIADRTFLVLRASAMDLRETMVRGAQTLSTKDMASIVFCAGILPGAVVVEAGAGSGGLTVALARAVGPSGKILSYDVREEGLSTARLNAAAAGVAEVIDFRLGDVRQGIGERDVDAVVLDLLDPWSAVGAAWEALRPCGTLATFSPNMEQVKETVAAIRAKPFVDVRTIEIIEREMEVRDVGVRPSFAALGHTGYLTFARKVLEVFDGPSESPSGHRGKAGPPAARSA
jgi:tRNA (adenine57-N1/adenine58-N1)-methyltransferase